MGISSISSRDDSFATGHPRKVTKQKEKPYENSFFTTPEISVPLKPAKPQMKSPLYEKIGYGFPFKPVDFMKSQNTPARNIEEVASQTGLSVNSIKMTIDMEGFGLKEYKDLKGIRTIGVGHNIEADPSYHFGKTITREQAFTLLKNDLIRSREELSTLVDVSKLTKGQMEALTDVTFNVGLDKLKGSKLIQYINEGKKDMATKEFNYICIGNRLSTFLCKRRILNLKSFSDGVNKNVIHDAMNTILKRGTTDLTKRIKEARTTIRKKELEHLRARFINETSTLINGFMKCAN